MKTFLHICMFLNTIAFPFSGRPCGITEYCVTCRHKKGDIMNKIYKIENKHDGIYVFSYEVENDDLVTWVMTPIPVPTNNAKGGWVYHAKKMDVVDLFLE